MDRLKWLYPGLGIKRWIMVSFLGAASAGAGLIMLLVRLAPKAGHSHAAGIVLLTGGLLMVLLGFRNLIASVISGLVPEMRDEAADQIYRTNSLKRGPKVVVVGGGTGLSVLLRGLKQFTSNITAIVTVADDGGSSGRIRGEFGVLPPGDIRNCLVALADKETLMEELFQYRFKDGEGLAGHSLGNLLIAAMSKVTGNFQAAVREMSRVLAIRGQVLPATLNPCSLGAEFEDGSIVEGESNIPRTGKAIRRVFLRPGNCHPVPEALQALGEADVIVLGPGSLFTSVIPNLLVEGMAEAVFRSPAVKVYVCNIMTQPGETDGFKASDHIRAILGHSLEGLLDYAIVNVEDIPKNLLRKYMQDGSVPVRADLKGIEGLGVKPVKRKMVFKADMVRHEPDKLAAAILELAGDFRPGKESRHLFFLHRVKSKEV